MFSRPAMLQEYLTHHGLIDEVYQAMDSPDYAHVVVTVKDILQKTKQLPELIKEPKTENMSTAFRNEGNQAYTKSKYQKALLCYNKALLFAPKNSRALKLAYSNRSALLHKMQAYSACISDIDTCFSMDCPSDIVDKLKKRKEEAKNNLWMEHIADDAKYTNFAIEYFHKNTIRNPVIPCATADIDVIIESKLPKIIATRDIKVGAVIAVEKAFVSHTDKLNSGFSCYYCHKMSMNLKPCDKCCVALFCSDICKTKCGEEYHEIECQIIEVVEAISQSSLSRMAIQAVLKMKSMSKSWTDLVAASFDMGIRRIKRSPVNQYYDSNYRFSLLNVKDERHFLSGSLYNAAFKSAIIIHYLENISCFLPQAEEQKTLAIHALGRLMVFLTLYVPHTQIVLSLSVNEQEKTECHDIPNFGWFSFISKLEHSCNPKVIALGLHKEIALVAVQPIKSGTELTLSYIGHWLEHNISKQTRQRNMFNLYGIVCNCTVCTVDTTKNNSYMLTDIQKKTFRKLNLPEMRMRFNPKNIPEIYMKLCKALAFLHDLPHSKEYFEVYILFRRCLLYFQDIETSNVILDYA